MACNGLVLRYSQPSRLPLHPLIKSLGGAFLFGSGSLPGYDGTRYASNENIVLVTMNYRTNVFGFPSAPEIPIKERNLGLLDEGAALEWVQRNIKVFGGDAEKVTIFGQSAGGFSVDALLTSYSADSKPPFRAGIMQSGQMSVDRRAVAPNSTASPL
jgi:carboxylesterase type B